MDSTDPTAPSSIRRAATGALVLLVALLSLAGVVVELWAARWLYRLWTGPDGDRALAEIALVQVAFLLVLPAGAVGVLGYLLVHWLRHRVERWGATWQRACSAVLALNASAMVGSAVVFCAFAAYLVQGLLRLH